ncbi:MAG: hypothetical protein ACXABK_06290 [Candidatus Heimdallarchaeaceae archaeon]
MSEYSEYMKQARKDVNLCIEIWKNIFEEHYAETIDYAYSKGSAIKEWESFIDYVPVLSDVDIHIKTKEYSGLFNDDNSFYESLSISEMYENTFIEMNPDFFHLPRTQIIRLNTLVSEVEFVPPRKSEVLVLTGNPEEMEIPHTDEIKRIDLKNLHKLEEFLSTLSMHIIDRTGLDLWSMARRINWRVSPAPRRLLSQTYEKPMEIWGMNRTQLAKELENHDFLLISENFKDYYYEGWIAFMEGFSNSQTLRRLISAGYEVLKQCLQESRNF